MRKILIFLLILASFSCATLDSNVKEDSNVEKNDKVEEPKKESSVAGIEKNIATSDSEELVKPKESINPTKESSVDTTIQKEEEKTPVNSDVVEVKDEKKESKKEEKTDTKEEKKSDKETLQKSDNKKIAPTTNVESKKEEVKSTIADERALQDYNDLFSASSRVEPKKEEKKEEQRKILPYLEILKELEEAVNFFKKAPPSVATKQRVEKKEKDVSAQRSEKEKPEEPKKELEEVKPTTEVVTKDETPSSDVSSIDNFNDEEPTLSFEDDSLLSFNSDDEGPYSFDDEDSFTFNDGEQFSFDDEKKDETINKQNADNKGQLSSVVDEEDKVSISRYTNIIKGQNIDFSYPGEGWVYLGEENSQKGLNYIKRKMEDGKTIFTFSAENMGNYVLNFSYFDVFSGDFIVDAVSVKVMPNDDGIQKDSLVLEYQGKDGKKPNDKKTKKTPNDVNVDADKVGINTDGAVIKEEKNSTKQSNKTTNVESNMETVKPAFSEDKKRDATYKEPEVFTNIANISPGNAKTKLTGEDARKIIDEVSKEISNGNAKRALERLDDFFAVSSTNMDEAYFLRGKAYELNTEQKNIKMALAAYKFLTKTFPDSPFWNEADARIRYIEKFFVKIK